MITMFTGKVKHTIRTTIIAGSVAVLFSNPAMAVDLGGAKASGWLCEQANGFLRINAGAPGDAQALANSVNQQRQAAYNQIAAKNGVMMAEVAKIAANKVRQSAPQFACK